MQEIYAKIERNTPLTREDALTMLETELDSPHYYRLLALAGDYSHRQFDGRGRVFAQIGLDAQPCPAACKFCSLAQGCFAEKDATRKSDNEIAALARSLVAEGAQELFLMTTAAFDQQEFLRIGRMVRPLLPPEMPMVANVGDFDAAYAVRLREAGFTGVYHICRLGEGVDTEVTVARRVATLDAIQAAGLELYYCVEPIGPEHTNEQLAEEIFRTQGYNVGVMAVMRRTAVPGSALYSRGEIPAHRLALICAVTTLCARPRRAMGVHEPELLSLMAGANQIYAETGVNPRDTHLETQRSRGFSVARARKLLQEAGWQT